MKKLKKEIIVNELLFLIARKSLEEKKGDITEIYYPLQELSTHLGKKYNIEYHSQQHLYNQLKKYEKKLEIILFKKKTLGNNIFIQMCSFHHFKHLKILNKNIKLLLANGAYDLLEKIITQKSQAINIYLGDGSECYYIAQLLFQKYKNPLNIYTNNLGIIQLIQEQSHVLKNISCFTRTGHVNQETYSINEFPNKDNIDEVTFDAIFQSPRYIDGLDVCEIYEETAMYKAQMLSKTQGTKILPLTLFEFLLPKDKIIPYGTLMNYDYLIIPSKEISPIIYQNFIETLPLELFKNYFSYEIYKIKRTQ